VTGLAGVVGVIAFAWLTLFQLLLALGVPFGAMAWGGARRVLPRPLRWASLASAVFAGLGGLTVVQASGFGPSLLPAIVLRPLLWAFAALFALSLVGNAASSSRIERLHGVPLALVLSLCCGALALS
jgi:hypothetical protein